MKTKPLQKWEYTSLCGVHMEDLDKELNRLASEGWELFYLKEQGQLNFNLIFKHPKV